MVSRPKALAGRRKKRPPAVWKKITGIPRRGEKTSKKKGPSPYARARATLSEVAEIGLAWLRRGEGNGTEKGWLESLAIVGVYFSCR